MSSASDPKAAETNNQPKAKATQNVHLPRNVKGQSKTGNGNPNK